jgi:hypothetical protein
MTMQNEKFEELLSAELARQLEPQRGKAAAAFATQIAAETAQREAAERAAREVAGGSKSQENWARGQVSKRALWVWMSVPSLLAACLAVVVTFQFVGGPSNPDLAGNGTGPTGTNTGSAITGMRATEGVGTGTVASQVDVVHNQPGAIIIQDNQPMREIHQQQIRKVQWQDPDDHATYSITEEPTETVIPVPAQPY